MLNAIVAKAMANEPQQRYSRARELADELQEFLSSPKGLQEDDLKRTTRLCLSRLRCLLIAGVAVLMLTAVLSSFLWRGASPSVPVVSAGLVGYWAGNGNAIDASVRGHHGTLRNGTSFAPGVLGEAFYFDGIDDWIATDQSFADLQSHTISVWVRWDGYCGESLQGIVGWWNTTDPIPYRMFLGTFRRSEREAWLRYGEGWRRVPGSIPLGKWVHIAVTYDGPTGGRCVYLDGVLAARLAENRPCAAHFSTTMAIGRQGDRPGEYWRGAIDELALYDRVLNAEEIARNARLGIR